MTTAVPAYLRPMLSVIAACTVALGCNAASTSPIAGRLIFAGVSPNCKDCGAAIYTSDTAGGDVRPLLTGLGWPEHISVSPDGWMVLFEDRGALDIADASGRHVRSLQSGGATISYAPAWSPDGQWIVFDWDDSTGPHAPASLLYRIHPDGSGQERVTRATDRYEYDPAFSRDGKRLAFIAADRKTGTRWVVVRDMTTDSERVVSDTGFTGFDPTWSPDGSALLFLDGTMAWGMWRLDLHTRAYAYFANSEGNRAPRYSPDGRTLVFGTGDLWVADSSGKNERRLVSDSMNYFGANWAPASTP